MRVDRRLGAGVVVLGAVAVAVTLPLTLHGAQSGPSGSRRTASPSAPSALLPRMVQSADSVVVGALTATVTLPAAVSSGDVLVMAYGGLHIGNEAAVTSQFIASVDQQGATWTRVAGDNDGEGDAEVWMAAGAHGDGDQIAVMFSTADGRPINSGEVTVSEWSGIGMSAGEVTHSVSVGTGRTANVPPLTPAGKGGNLFVAAIESGGGPRLIAGPNGGAHWTVIGESYSPGIAAYTIASGSAARAPAFGNSNGEKWEAVTAAFAAG